MNSEYWFLEVVKRGFLVWISEVAVRLKDRALWEESEGANIMEELQYAASRHSVKVLFQSHFLSLLLPLER